MNNENAYTGMSDTRYLAQIEKYYQGNLDRTQPLVVGKTTNALALAGADRNLDIIINPRTLDKCTGSPDTIYHGHSLERGILEQLPAQLRNPVMIFKNTDRNSLVAITDLKDSAGHGVMIAVALEQKSKRHIVNRISSIYGKDRIFNYINNQISLNNLVAANKTKADIMLQSRGLQLPKEETYISYNDSIIYSLDNVKYPKHLVLENAAYKEAAVTADKASDYTYSPQGNASPTSQFLKDLYANDFVASQKLINNYSRLLISSFSQDITLSDIARLYVSGTDNLLINEIGDELKQQELMRQPEINLEEEP